MPAAFGDTTDLPALMITGIFVNSVSKFSTSVKFCIEGRNGVSTFFSYKSFQSMDLKKGCLLISSDPCWEPSLDSISNVSKPESKDFASSETNLGMFNEPERI